ncbi:hypothetical protein DPMN_151071 [Dreissena polymorpha]|uniref:Uncharacterized protein n=1 Tax=Dreissena polymorpha TaxID=45954 RepID=A0A9D4FJ68_DREPO|nr:hypothetical protein DPMN_151071 [Dreissena polymorpha]
MQLFFKSVSVPAVLRILGLLLVDMEVVLDSNLYLRMDGAIDLPVPRIEATALLPAEVRGMP